MDSFNHIRFQGESCLTGVKS